MIKINNFKSWKQRLVIAVLILFVPLPLLAIDLTQVLIHTLEDRQEGKVNGYRFRIALQDDDGDLNTVQVSSPAGHLVNLDYDSVSEAFVFEQNFVSLDELRVLFPLGNYAFDFNTGFMTGILPHNDDIPVSSPGFKLPLDKEVVAQVDPVVILEDVDCANCFFGSVDLRGAASDHYMQEMFDIVGIPFPVNDNTLSSIPLVPGQAFYRFGVNIKGPYSILVRTYSGFFKKFIFAADLFDFGSGGIRENSVEILVAGQVGGTTYYVDFDTGDDSNVGTNIMAPLKTLTAINNVILQAGDTVLLKRGSVWRGEALLLHESGSPYNYIRIGAYGQGARPRIRPIELYQDGWVDVGNDIFTQATSQPASGDDFLGAVFENDNRMSFVESLTELNSPGQATWLNGDLYIRSTSGMNPNNAALSYRVAPVVAPNDTSLGVDLRGNFYIVEDLDIAYVGHYGIGQQYKTSNDNAFSVIRRNVVAHSFHDLIAFGLWGGTVEYNVVQDTQDFGIACLDVGAGNTRDVIVRNNFIANCKIGLTPEGSVIDIRWQNNTVLWCDRGVSAVSKVNSGQAEHKPIGNSFKGNLLAFNGIGFLLGGAGANFDTGTVIEGNRITSSTKSAIAWALGSDSAVDIVKNNQIFQTGGSAINLSGEINGLELVGNVITGANSPGTAAIEVGLLAKNITILNNTIHDNNAGVVFQGETTGNRLHANIITDSSSFNIFMTFPDNLETASHNLYDGSFSVGEGFFYAGISSLSISDLQTIGLEISSVYANPSFIDPAAGDFSLAIDSPAIDSSFDYGRMRDLRGNPMVDVGGVANTGGGVRNYLDRGALEYTVTP